VSQNVVWWLIKAGDEVQHVALAFYQLAAALMVSGGAFAGLAAKAAGNEVAL
jgi:hypothetical protein